MDLEDIKEFEELATLISGYANLTRLVLMLGFYQGYTAKEVTDFLDISRAGVQKNIERMVDAELVYRPAADEAPTYALTPLGEFFAQIFEVYGPVLLTTIFILREAEADVRQQLQDSPVTNGLSPADRERLVHTRKWQEVNDRISELLESVTQDPASAKAKSTPSRTYAFESDLSSDEIADILEEIKEETEE